MEFYYNDTTGTVCSIYWSDGLDSKAIQKNYNIYDVLQIWYPKNVNDDIYEQYKMIMTFSEYRGYWKRPVQSLECNLLRSVDEILSQMRKNTRYEIRRAMNRDKLQTTMITAPLKDDVEEYIAYYNKFADSKKMHHINEQKIKALAQQGMYSITRCLDSEDTILAEHAYYLDKKEKRVMLATSASMFRENESPEYRNLIGRANRMLHYKDLLDFKELGYEVYDYGGIGDYNDELKAIAEFKLGFGGTVRTYDASFTLHLKKQRLIDEKINSLQSNADLKMVIYGFGWVGRYVADKIEKYGIYDYTVIDNYAESTQERVYYKDEDLKLFDQTKTRLLITLAEKSYAKIEKKLNDLGYREGDNIITLLF